MQQIENEKKDSNDVEQQIGNLSNIIQYENANILQSFLKDNNSKNKVERADASRQTRTGFLLWKTTTSERTRPIKMRWGLNRKRS